VAVETVSARMNKAAELDAYLTEAQGRAFDWSTWNCCHLAAGWVRRMSGRDVMADVPVTTTKRAAHREIQRRGGTLRAVWERWLGAEAIAPDLAQVGDIVGLTDADAQAVGVCCGRTVAVLTQAGVCHVPMTRAACAWRLQCAQ
jgi:hypothetical protein